MPKSSKSFFENELRVNVLMFSLITFLFFDLSIINDSMLFLLSLDEM